MMYGYPIDIWCVSVITDFNGMFANLHFSITMSMVGMSQTAYTLLTPLKVPSPLTSLSITGTQPEQKIWPACFGVQKPLTKHSQFQHYQSHDYEFHVLQGL